MSIELNKMVVIIDNYLNITQINDYCPNGLQITGKSDVHTVISGVTANLDIIKQAISHKACALLVHHGYFWRGENPCITGIKQQRIKLLLEHDISLLAYHLPLDLHPTVGNNVQLAKRLNLKNCTFLSNNIPVLVGNISELTEISQLADNLTTILKRAPQVIAANRKITKIAICTGSGQNYFDDAIRAGADVFITGEATEHNFHSANEYQVNFIAAGHHATERFGIQALGDYIAEEFAIKHKFIDCDNPF